MFTFKKRKQIEKYLSLVGYSLFGMLLVVVTAVLVAIASGYSYNFKSGEIESYGLALIDSSPDEAVIFVDGKSIEKFTPKRVNLSVGNHTIQLFKDKYREWRRDFDVAQGEVIQLEYIKLLPETISTSSVYELPDKSKTAYSPTSKRLAILTTNSKSLKLLDLNDKVNEVTLDLNSVIKESKFNFTTPKWSENGRYILTKVVSKQGSRFLYIDTLDNANTRYVTKLIKQNSGNVHFDNRSDQFLLWLVNSELRQIDLTDNSTSLLSSGVISVASGDRDVFIVNTDKELEVLGSRDDQSLEPFLVDNVNVDIVTHSFGDERYLIVNDLTSNSSLILRVELGAFTKVVGLNGEVIHSRDGNKRIISRDNSNFNLYNLDSGSLSAYKVNLASIEQVNWINDHYLAAVADNSMYIFEFDGSNFHEIVDANSHTIPFINDDFSKVFTSSQSQITGQKRLQASSLVVD